MRVKRFVKICMLLFVLIVFISCTGDRQKDNIENEESNNTINNNDPIKIKFISSWGGFDTKAEILERVLNNFLEENPGITVINESMAGSDFLFKIKKDFASGDDPDVFCLWPGSDIQALIKAGKIADLTQILEDNKEWKDSFHSVEWAPIMQNDKIYGLPIEVIFEVLFCNMDLFEKYDVKRPANFEELKEAVIKFRDAGIIPIAYNTKPEGSYLYQNIIAQLGSIEDIENPIKNNQVSQCYIDAMAYVKELYKLDAFPESALTLTNADRDYLFINKKAAMIVQGSWFIGNFEVNDPTIDIIPFPKLNDNVKYPSLIYGLGAGIYYMSENAANDIDKKNACVTFLKYMTSPYGIIELANRTGMISNVNIERKKTVAYNKISEKGILMIDYSLKKTSPPDHFVNRTIWEDIIVKKFPYYLEGRLSAIDLWEEAVERYNVINGND